MFRSAAPNWARIDSLLGRLADIRQSLAIYLVACVKGITSPVRDYASHSLQTEFFSEQELAHIIGHLRRFGLFVQTFTSEMAFIEHVGKTGPHTSGFSRTVVLNTAHSGSGPGRKALIPAFCDLNGIAYTGSNAQAVALARHKFHSACIIRACGFNVPRSWFYVPENGWCGKPLPLDGSKVIVKLTYESASIGLSPESVRIADESLASFLEGMVAQFNQPLTVQEFVPGREVKVPIVHLETGFSPMAVSIVIDGNDMLGDQILTYDRVNEDQYGFLDYSRVSPDKVGTLESVALSVGQLLGFRGLSRIDFRVNEAGEYFVTDVSTSPHITPHSSFGYAFKNLERDGQLPLILVALACARMRWI